MGLEDIIKKNGMNLAFSKDKNTINIEIQNFEIKWDDLKEIVDHFKEEFKAENVTVYGGYDIAWGIQLKFY